MRGADLLVKTLAEAGVSRIFALSGNQIMPIFDACIDAGITLVHTRHEAAAVFMAEAYAQLTGQPGVALVTAGGGLANTPGALLSAMASETPLVLLSGDSPRAQDGKGAFQEIEQTAITRAVTKHAHRAETTAGLGADLRAALDVAQGGRPGPVHLALPVDLLSAELAADRAPSAPSAAPGGADPAMLATLRGALAGAARPLVVLPPFLNATRTGGLPARLGAALGVPVAVMESPRGLNDPAYRALKSVVHGADLIVSLGKKIDFTTGFGAGPARWLVVAPDSAEIARARLNLGDRLAEALLACPRALALALAEGPASGPTSGPTSGTAMQPGWAQEAAHALAPMAAPAASSPDAAPESPTLCAAVAQVLSESPAPLLISDGGEFGQWAQALVQAPARVVNGTAGAIGGGLPYAMGARAARPEATIVAMSGDGSIGFHLAEFETAAREGLAFVLVIGNDRRWNAEHQIQLRSFGPERLIGCELGEARYDLAAAALGAHGEYVTRSADLLPALRRALASGKPACVNVAIEGLPAPAAH